MQKNEHENDPDEVGAKCILKKLPPPEIKQSRPSLLSF